jgi:hypothetical protein
MKPKTLYRVAFINQERIYEVYARKVYQSDIFGFIAIEEFVYGETSTLVVDPGQERLKTEFVDVKCTYIPMHAILRIDEVEKEGIAKITLVNHENNISHFPSPIYSKPPENLN